ncbi:MAG: low-specificity L-threonine aldolase [Bacillota bacterium]|jgi:threonine aldolase
MRKMETFIDLRSDTVTQPTPEMLQAIISAQVGDDCSREDPTVNRLEAMAASRLGKEAGLLVPSGTMGNLVSVLAHTHRGDEVIMESECHIYYYEVGSISAVAGVIPRLVKGNHGVLDPDDLKKAIRGEDIHYPTPTLIAVENTHNRGGGTVTSVEQSRAICDVAKDRGLSTHLDGARIFNAAVALGVDARELAQPFDSVMFCLSKGLSAPVGSVVVGSREFIERARKYRKMLGGGMRQAGIIAAAGIVALETMVDRLEEDHINARYLGEGLAEISGIQVELETVQTNMVYFDVGELGFDSVSFLKELEMRKVRASLRPPTGVRMVTHRHISRENISYVLEVVEEIAKSRSVC